MRRKPNRETTCPVCGTVFWNPKKPNKRFCTRKCAAQVRPTTPWQERFWRYLKPGNADECWEWQGGLDGSGYGTLKREAGVTVRASRASWEIHNGPIPPGLHVLHHCDNPPCCNPAHLFLGTQADNNADMVAKGRDRKATGDDHWKRKHVMTARLAPEGS